MTYLAPTMDMGHGAAPDAFSKMLMPGLDMVDHHSNFDAHTFAGSDDFFAVQTQLSPSLKRFSTAPDDAFSDVVSAFDNTLNQETRDGEANIERNNKVLSFLPSTLDFVLLDYTYRRTTVSLTAQLHGMFFLAQSPWANNGDASAPPAELTCYRRNLFQIAGNVTLPRALRCIMTDQGKEIAILSQELVVSATESTEGNSVKIISVPWKTPANHNPPAAEDNKAEKEPPTVALDLTTMQDSDSDFANIPFQWKRLQFRIATANNGRRKELQQHFVIHLSVMATLATGGKVCICEAKSGAIIVRGRSPRNFQSRNDTLLNGASSQSRKAAGQVVTQQQPNIQRTSTGDSAAAVKSKPLQQQQSQTQQPPPPPPPPPPPQQQQQQQQQTMDGTIKTDNPAPAMSIHSFYDPNEFQLGPDLFSGLMHQDTNQAQRQHQGSMTALPQDVLPFDRAGYPISSPDLSKPLQPLPPAKAPQKLSLVEDETPMPTSSSISPPARHNSSSNKRMAPPRAPSTFSLNVVSSPDESADLLYEYFPLGLDDWMPPVDAVYRPHVVHHISTGTTGVGGGVSKALAGRSKRYFSEDVG
ncbi:hypothetical protein MBLNU459_g7568t1 [Dothideomycetes sp. NU459]